VPTLDLERQLLREYIDLPGLSLTLPQVSRLLSAETPTCCAVLKSLEDAGCLTSTADGKYVRMPRHSRAPYSGRGALVKGSKWQKTS
jgi:hypothetical protein